MADKYPDFRTLSRHERPGVDFRILVRLAQPRLAVVAPHGGGIEPGTSEIADAIAALELSFYAFEGLKRSGNADLHITSTRFDEPMCLSLIGQSRVVLTIHGEHSQDDGEGVFVGGLDTRLCRSLGTALRSRGFTVGRHPDPRLQGLEPTNVCNRGKSGRGVQLEISRGLREQMFDSLSREGRKHPTARFRAFVAALRSVIVAGAVTRVTPPSARRGHRSFADGVGAQPRIPR
jgi:phage replication-related protein YjqB (UPF0714/DUF867 family)